VELDLFAGIPVSSFATAQPWYEQLFGNEPSFLPHETEAVWELAPHRFVFIVEDGARAGSAIPTVMVDDLETLVTKIAARGIEPAEREAYGTGARKAIYRDADGNEIGFGGVPDD
jgi:hypothetical protein